MALVEIPTPTSAAKEEIIIGQIREGFLNINPDSRKLATTLALQLARIKIDSLWPQKEEKREELKDWEWAHYLARLGVFQVLAYRLHTLSIPMLNQNLNTYIYETGFALKNLAATLPKEQQIRP